MLICPKCGDEMCLFKLGYRCINKSCTFWIPRVIRQKVLSEDTVRELVEKKETGFINGFHKLESSQIFSAKLYITNNWKIAFRLKEKTDLRCPRCNAFMMRFDRGFECFDKEKCNFVLWDRFGQKKLTEEQMKQLLVYKKTDLIHGFVSK